MQELATQKAKIKISEVKLDLEKTNIPSDALPLGEHGERLLLPTQSRLRLVNDGISIEMIVQDPETWGNQFYEQPTFDDDNPPVISLNLPKDEILKATVGETTYFGTPLAVLHITDPSDVEDSFELTFASKDPNNPGWAIKALVKMLRGLDISVEEIRPEPKSTRDQEIPF